MMLPDIYSLVILANYADFSLATNEFCRYYEKQLGKSKSDYQTEFDKLRLAFEKLINGLDLLPDIVKPTRLLFEQIKALLSTRKFSESQIVEIAELVREYQVQHEKNFRTSFWVSAVEVHSKRYYQKELYDLVNDLLDEDQYESAVMAAFKYLDAHMQKLLKVSAHKYYGEDLVNYALAPNSGILQLDTHQNEQVGLRNLFSGAYAYFRNPTAHRLIEYDEFSAHAIIAMVALMAQTVSRLAEKEKAKNKQAS